MSDSPATASLPRRRWQFGLPQLFALVTCFAGALAVGKSLGWNPTEIGIVTGGFALLLTLVVLPGLAFALIGVRSGPPEVWGALGGAVACALYVVPIVLSDEGRLIVSLRETNLFGAFLGLLLVLVVLPTLASTLFGARYGRPEVWGALGGGLVCASYLLLVILSGEDRVKVTWRGMAFLGAGVGLLCGIGARREMTLRAADSDWPTASSHQSRRGRNLLLGMSIAWLLSLHLAAISGVTQTATYRDAANAASLNIYGPPLVALPILVGFGASWAAHGRRWFALRLAVLGGVLAIGLNLRPGDLTLLFGVQALLVIAIVRLVGDWRRDGSSPRASQWTTYPPLAAAAFLLAALAAIMARDQPNTAAAAALAGACLGVLTLVSAWTVFGRSRWWLRAAGLTLATAWAGDSMVALAGSRSIGRPPMFEIVRYEHLGWWWFIVSTTVAATLVVLLGSWRFATRTSPTTQRSSITANALPRLAVRAAAGCLVVGLLVSVTIPPAKLYRRVVDWPNVPPSVLPSPNGFDDLLRADASLPRQIMIEPQNVDEKRGWVVRHSAEMALARQGLARESGVPEGSRPAIGELCTLFEHAGDVATSEGRFADALACHLDVLRIIRAVSSRGDPDYVTGEDYTVRKLIGNLSSLRHHLTVKQLCETVAALQTMEADMAPLDVVARRSKEQARDWRTRLLWLLDDPRSPRGRIADARHSFTFGRAGMRLLMCEWTLAAYREEHGRFPATLTELTPDLLSDVPLDPYGPLGEEPLIYRSTGDGFLLYSIGPDGRDDGGNQSVNTWMGDLSLQYFESLRDY